MKICTSRHASVLSAFGAALLLATTAFAPAEDASPGEDGFFQVTDWEPTGDWNGGSAAEVGDALGQDLVAAAIRLDAEQVYTFRIQVTSLPAIGGTPEATRYGWSFTYNGAKFELDGKFSNYSRGACDPTSGQCPPPRDPGLSPFLLRGNCVTEGSLTTCEELASVSAIFDPAAGTIDVPLPAALLTGDAGVQECDRIAGDGSLFGTSIWVAPSAFLTLNTGPSDKMFVDFDFVVPSTDPEVVCDA